MSALIDGLAPDGELLVIGASLEPISVNGVGLLAARKTIQGWPSGTAKDSEETLEFSALSGVRPMIEKFPLEKAAEGYAHMMSGKARFRVVLTMGS
jgi:D-arabinose 1-dehydrogenase-like Zn-dependent alcohol dehydrogenase